MTRISQYPKTCRRIKLTASKVSIIKDMLRTGKLTTQEIAHTFRISPKTVRDIKQGKYWKWVP